MEIGSTLLSSALPLSILAGTLIGIIRIAIAKRGDLFHKALQGMMTGGLFFIIIWAVLQAIL